MKYKPTLIIHGGAGALSRSSIPPHLYDQYHASLLAYLRSTRDLLNSGSSALDAAVHAVSLLEDDELFNCARGSVFTSAGTIEMEASVMVTSVDSPGPGSTKRGVGVIGLRNVRHPIRLANEVLLRDGLHQKDDGGSMHAQLSAPYVEDLARQWGLEFQPDEYFWTKRRWDEHVRKLRGEGQGQRQTATQVSSSSVSDSDSYGSMCDNTRDSEVEMRSDGKALDSDPDLDLNSLPQGTVGCVCLDMYGNLAVATSTGGMTNKLPGRVGDTPTLGAGFWAERWTESSPLDMDFTSRLYSPPSAPFFREEEGEGEEIYFPGLLVYLRFYVGVIVLLHLLWRDIPPARKDIPIPIPTPPLILKHTDTHPNPETHQNRVYPHHQVTKKTKSSPYSTPPLPRHTATPLCLLPPNYGIDLHLHLHTLTLTRDPDPDQKL